jgi:hypothetical protein
MYATRGTELMPYGFLVEAVGAQIILRGEQAKLRSRNAPQQRAFARTDRAIAVDDLAKVALDLERHPAAVAATLVCHLARPLKQFV